MSKKPTGAQYIAAARSEYEEEGEVEFDDNPPVSHSDDPGAYVQAWVWVRDEDAAKEDV